MERDTEATVAQVLAEVRAEGMAAALRWTERFDGLRLAESGLRVPRAAMEAALLRLIELYHCELVTDDPYHHRVRPALRRAVSRQGNL